MSSRNERFYFRPAGPQDSRDLLKLYESEGFAGNISVLFTRRPDPYQSLMKEGDDAVIPVVLDRDADRVCGMGACIIHKVNLNGVMRRAGYLTGLKSLPEYRKRVPFGTAVYSYLHELTREKVDFYYTTILKDNVAAQKMLEKKRRNMPQYRYAGEYTVYCFRAGTLQRDKGLKGYDFRTSNIAEVQAAAGNASLNFNLSPAGTNWPGLTDNDCYVMRDDDGKTIAACAVWNQQSYKQYVITRYGGIYRFLRSMPLKLFGYPNLPKEKQPVHCASITMLTVSGNDVRLASYFLEQVARAAKTYDFLMLGLHESHPLNASMSKIRSIKYRSRVYTVHWSENSLVPDERPFNIEVGLL
jgi:hypothetical protein